MKCDRCKSSPESVCPCYVTLLGGLTQSEMDPKTKVISRRVMPLPFATTVYLCQACNRERLNTELEEGLMNIPTFKAWLGNFGEDKVQH